MKKKIEIVEVGPRDGFQNVSEFIPTKFKKEIINKIILSGIKSIQATSFVHPNAVPQMKDAESIIKYCLRKHPNINLSALVPNLYGAKLAIESGLTEISYVISISETHNKKNINRTHKESFDELSEIVNLYPNTKVNLDIATAFGCVFEGEFSKEKVMDFIESAYKIGVNSFTLCDTMGLAHPTLIEDIVNISLKKYPNCEFQIHIHDTRNMGMINSFTALKCGIKKIQTSLGGLGGCPFAPGASGNTSTEDFVYMLNKMNYKTGIDSEELIRTAKHLKDKVNGNYSGHQIYVNQNKI